MSEDYLSFERVMRELKIAEEELKRMVSAGELRAFRDTDQTKFKKEDVEKFLKSKKREDEADAIDLLEGDLDLGEEETKVPASKSEDLTEELVFDDVDLGEDVGMKTEPLSKEDLFGGEELEEDKSVSESLVIEESQEETLLGDEGAAPGLRRSRLAAATEEPAGEGPAFLGLMVLTGVVLLLGVIAVVDIATSSPSPMVDWLVSIFK